jgi:hypothetical protein
VSPVDPRLVAAFRRQLERRPAGARRLGWKVGGGERESIGGELAVGHLTYATQLEDGAVYSGGGEKLYADVEVAVKLGRQERIDGYAVALEINDLAADGDAEAIVADNIFHRAVAFGPFSATPPAGGEAALVVNGERRAAAAVRVDVAAKVAAVARVLDAVGERLEPGDLVITGLIVNTPVAPGDDVAAEIGPLGRVRLRIS